LALITPAFERQPVQQKTTMVDESRNVFTKPVLGEKHISGVMCENPGGEARSLLLPSADAHDMNSNRPDF